MPEFVYDKSISILENFLIWYDMNTYEKKAYGEEPYTLEEAKLVFDKLYC
tara:strand:+ start:1938 stop:2087 length:150 start_codon:yes stop_codon:yes gene_type:complete